jgi:hypothetical protein
MSCMRVVGVGHSSGLSLLVGGSYGRYLSCVAFREDKKRAEQIEPLMGMPGVHRNNKSR